MDIKTAEQAKFIIDTLAKAGVIEMSLLPEKSEPFASLLREAIGETNVVVYSSDTPVIVIMGDNVPDLLHDYPDDDMDNDSDEEGTVTFDIEEQIDFVQQHLLLNGQGFIAKEDLENVLRASELFLIEKGVLTDVEEVYNEEGDEE